MRIAPHLVHPMPIIIPTYGHGTRGREAMRLALRINDFVNYDSNGSLDEQKHIANGRTLSRREVLELLPDISPDGLNGGVMFFDAQVYNSERLVLSFLKSAAQIGGDLANYARVVSFLTDGARVIGAKVQDCVSGHEFDVRARVVVNSTGAWNDWVRQLLPNAAPRKPVPLAKAINIVTYPLFRDVAVGVDSHEPGNRLFYVTPWRHRSIIGTHYTPYDDHPESLNVTYDEIDQFLQRVNRSIPSAKLTHADVSFVHRGLLPVVDQNSLRSVHLRRDARIIDHARESIEGLVSVEGVRYATSRRVAVDVVDHILEMTDCTPVDSVSAMTPLRGGEMQRFKTYLERELAANSRRLDHANLKQLICNYGSDYADVLEYLPLSLPGRTPVEEKEAVLRAQIYHAVYKEMALKLGDIVFRRTELGTAEQPDAATLNYCARTMGEILNWGDDRIRREIDEVNAHFAWKR